MTAAAGAVILLLAVAAGAPAAAQPAPEPSAPVVLESTADGLVIAVDPLPGAELVVLEPGTDTEIARLAVDVDPASEPIVHGPRLSALEPREDAVGRSSLLLLGLEPGVEVELALAAAGHDLAPAPPGARTAAVAWQPSAAPDAEAADDVAATPGTVAPIESGGDASRAPVATAAEPAPVATVKGATALSVAWPAVASAHPSITTWVVEVLSSDEIVRTVYTTGGRTSTVVTGLTAATAYSVIVGDGADLWSPASASVITAAAAVAPESAARPTAVALDGARLEVSWPANETGAEVRHYIVRVLRDGDVVATSAAIDPLVGGTSTIVAGLTAATEYTATVTAVGYDLAAAASDESAPVSTLPGLPTAPTGVTLTPVAGEPLSLEAAWAPPLADGGFEIRGYIVELHLGASVSTAGLIARVEVGADTSSARFDDLAIVNDATTAASLIVARVTAVNIAGTGPRSSPSAGAGIRSTASPNTAVAPASIAFADPSAEGFTVSWAPPTGATATTGYLVRVNAFEPGNAATTTNAIRTVIDAGIGHPTTGTVSTRVTGLEAGTRWTVTVTAYEQTGAVRTYRLSSQARPAATSDPAAQLWTPGARAPWTPPSPPTPVSTATDRVSVEWPVGALVPEHYSGGSPITAYRVALFREGAVEAVGTVDIAVDAAASAAGIVASFAGLDRATTYQVRLQTVNAVGSSPWSAASAGVTTLREDPPGTVPPAFATVAEVDAAIAAGGIRRLAPAAAGLEPTAEPTSTIELALDWSGRAESGEVWAYGATGAPVFLGTVGVRDGRATGAVELGEQLGELTLLIVAGDDRPVATTIEIVAPESGPRELDDAVLRWGLSNEAGNGAFFGGCNLLVAGIVPDVGHGAVLTPDRYAAEVGDVRIEKPDASGAYRLASYDTRCLDRSGAPLTANPNTPFSQAQVVITGGTGVVDPGEGTASIEWEGDFTVAFYGGLTYWTASDPVLTIEHGVGTLRATVGGFGSDMDDLTRWIELAPGEVTLATIADVTVRSDGFTAEPQYAGVVNGRGDQVRSGPVWGSFPVDFIDFQEATGQRSYWYSSGGQTDAAKPALPITVGFDAASFVPPTAGADGTGAAASVRALRPPGALKRPGAAVAAGPVAAATVLVQQTVIRRMIDGGSTAPVLLAGAGALLGLLTIGMSAAGGAIALRRAAAVRTGAAP